MAEPKRPTDVDPELFDESTEFDNLDPDEDFVLPTLELPAPSLSATAIIQTSRDTDDELAPNPASDFDSPTRISPLGSHSAYVPEFFYKPSRPLTKEQQKTWPAPRLVRNLAELELTPDMYPSAGFLPTYLAWARDPAPAPTVIHLICALSALAVSMGQRWRSPFHRVSANFYAMIIAGSGVGKSTAMRLMRRLLERAFPVGSERLCVEELASKVAVFKRLSNFVESDGTTTRPVLWYLDEGDILLHVMSQPHSSQLAASLTTIYDGDSSTYRSLHLDEGIAVESPCVSLLTGTAPEWLLQRHLTPEFLRGGLFGRFWLIPASAEPTRCDPPPADEGALAALAQWLSELGAFDQPGMDETVVKFTPEADLEFTQFVDWLWRARLHKQAQATLMSDAWTRVTAHVAKLSLLYHASTYHDVHDPVNLDCVRRAIAFVHRYLMPGHLWAVQYLEKPTDSVQSTVRQVIGMLERRGMEAAPFGSIKAALGKTPVVEDAFVRLWQGNLIDFWVPAGVRGRPTIYVSLRSAQPAPSRAGLVLDTPPVSPPLIPGVTRWRPVLPAFVLQAIERDRATREDGTPDDVAPDDE